MKKFLWALLLFIPLAAKAQRVQNFGSRALTGPSVPSSCVQPSLFIRSTTGDVYTCKSGVFVQLSAGTATGTLTDFTAGNLSPIFTTNVANHTTTPALTFGLSSVAAHSYLGNNTGSSTAAAYVQPSSADLSDLSTLQAAISTSAAVSNQFLTG